MIDVEAGCIPMRVVSAKLENEWIIRGISAFDHSETKLVAAIQPFVTFHPSRDEVVWTTHVYRLPWYHVYGYADVPGTGWPARGVFVFRRVGESLGVHARYSYAQRLLDEQLRPV